MPKAEKKLYVSTFTFGGKRYYVRSSVSQRDADKKAAVRQRELEESRELVSPNMTVGQYAMIWVETYKEGKVSDPVYRNYLSLIRNVVEPQIGHLRLKDVRHINLQRVLNSQPGRSYSYYHKLRLLLRELFHRALKDHLLRDDPSDDLELPKAKAGTHRSLTASERACLIFAADWHSFGLFVQTLLWCGLRPQEAAALRYEDIDQINHRFMIRRALKADGTVGDTKSASGCRVVPIPPQLWVRLKPRLPQSGCLFRDTRGDMLSKKSIQNAWRAFTTWLDVIMGAETGIYYSRPTIVQSVIADDLTLYCLRHTYCTDLQAAGVPINVARELMGHSSIDLTAKIYTHMRDDVMDDAAEKIAAFGEKTGATVGATQISQIKAI